MLNKYIEEARERNNVSQNGLAKLIGISGASLSKIVNTEKASDETVFKIARLAGENPFKVYAEYKASLPQKPEDKKIWIEAAKKAEQYILC